MAKYKISGVWKDSDNIITHYAFHLVKENSIDFAKKTSKVEAVRILSQSENTAITWLWNYKNEYWQDGENVTVVSGSYLRSNQDGTVRDNLSHLIDYDWLRQ
jgi:hypothetical protein